MIIDTDILRHIYLHLGDNLSKEIFKNTLMFSISKDSKWILETARLGYRGDELFSSLEQASRGEMVLFGAGFWGKTVYRAYRAYPWKCCIDNNPQTEMLEDLPVISAKKFFEEYSGEYIVITSRLYHKEMYEQIVEAGVPEANIINIGQLQDELWKRQYFDLEYMEVRKEGEVFLDVGGLDGITAVHFNHWCNGNSFVYVFEPDKKNIEKCCKTLNSHGIQYKLIPKGAWSSETELCFSATANGTSRITDEGEERIVVNKIDNELKDEIVTFIKMDIEGSELEALIGAENVIKKNIPKLAISVYHRPEDIWTIPDIVLKFNPSYQLYLRQYTLTGGDTVLYAI